MRSECACPAPVAPLRLRGAADRGGGDRALPFLPRARPGGKMASLIPAATSSPAGAPSRSKKRPASPGTGSGPAKKKKVAASSGSQVTLAGGREARMCRGAFRAPQHTAHAQSRGGVPCCPRGVCALRSVTSCWDCSFVANERPCLQVSCPFNCYY